MNKLQIIANVLGVKVHDLIGESGNNTVEDATQNALKDKIIKLQDEKIEQLEKELNAMKSRNPFTKATNQ